MPRPLPDSYRRLGHYAARFAPGALVYEQGAVPDRCYVVLRGVVQFEALDASGEPAVVASAREGELVGHVAAFSGRPTSAAARAAGEAILLAIPFADLLAAFSEAPELALELIHAFADPEATSPTLRHALRAVVERPLEAPVEAPPEAPPAAPPPPLPAAPAAPPSTAVEHALLCIEQTFDAELFFLDFATCPVCDSRFEYLRIRTRSVRPLSRDSDFYVRYHSLDPTHYSIVVCPACGYAAYSDDFDDLSADERSALLNARPARLAMMEHSLAGLRSTEDGVAVTELALSSYALRHANERRHAVLLHRRAWIERERGDAEAERTYLAAARDAYRAAYERDSAISEESAMRAAYLIGDLTLRLGDARQAARWLETATRSPEAKSQTGLTRMARERLYDAHTMLNDGQESRRPA